MANGLKLNVILHGAFAYLDNPAEKEFIDALIPLRKIADEDESEKAEKPPNGRPTDEVDHTFRAGNWLGETEIRQGTYRLEGVATDGTAAFKIESNLIFKPKKCRKRRPRNPLLEHARLILPRPDDIASLRLAEVKLIKRPDGLEGDKGAAIQVFTYRVKDEMNLRLQRVSDDEKENRSGHYWEPIPTEGYVNLHIFSAEDHPDDPKHTRGAFDATSNILGLQVGLLQEVHRAAGIEEKDLPTGVIAEETEDLAIRTLRMAKLGRLLRLKSDLSQAWLQNEALDGSPESCLGKCGC